MEKVILHLCEHTQRRLGSNFVVCAVEMEVQNVVKKMVYVLDVSLFNLS